MTASVFLVVANRSDVAARNFAFAAGPDVRLMTPADLSQPGWRFHSGDAAASTAVLAGEAVPAAAIAGVLVRLPGVSDDDLPHIVASDRAYVAAEMTAFLLAWLTALKCPLINRPTPQCLSGPMWRQEQWVVVASRLGIPVKPVVRRALLGKAAAAVDDVSPAVTTITVVGRDHVGEADTVLVKRSRALADAAGADLLAVQFDGNRGDANFAAASLWPDLGDGKIAAAVMKLMRRKAAPAGAGRSDDIALGYCAG